MFAELPNISPMVIGIWSGASKPILNEYISLLIAELESVLTNGMVINNHHVTVNFGFVLCDTPARSLMKGTFEQILCEHSTVDHLINEERLLLIQCIFHK